MHTHAGAGGVYQHRRARSPWHQPSRGCVCHCASHPSTRPSSPVRHVCMHTCSCACTLCTRHSYPAHPAAALQHAGICTKFFLKGKMTAVCFQKKKKRQMKHKLNPQPTLCAYTKLSVICRKYPSSSPNAGGLRQLECRREKNHGFQGLIRWHAKCIKFCRHFNSNMLDSWVSPEAAGFFISFTEGQSPLLPAPLPLSLLSLSLSLSHSMSLSLSVTIPLSFPLSCFFWCTFSFFFALCI